MSLKQCQASGWCRYVAGSWGLMAVLVIYVKVWSLHCCAVALSFGSLDVVPSPLQDTALRVFQLLC